MQHCIIKVKVKSKLIIIYSKRFLANFMKMLKKKSSHINYAKKLVKLQKSLIMQICIINQGQKNNINYLFSMVEYSRGV